MPQAPVRLTALALVVVLAGCSGPSRAPTELDELCAFLYEHMGHEDPGPLAEGVHNLDTWLADHFAEMDDGFEIETMSQEVLDALGGDHARDASALVGGVVATTSDFTVDDLAQGLLVADRSAIHPDTMRIWRRSFLDDVDCFVDHRCDEVAFTIHSVSDLPLSLEVTADTDGHYRWVDARGGLALVSRTHFTAPAQVEPTLFELRDQHDLTVNFASEGRLVRLHALWVDAEIVGLNISESAALGLLIDALQAQDEQLYAWLDVS